MNELIIPFPSERELMRFLEEQFPICPTRVLALATGPIEGTFEQVYVDVQFGSDETREVVIH